MSNENTKQAPQSAADQTRAQMIAERITRSNGALTKAQAEEVVDRQLARNAKPVKTKAATPPIPDAVARGFEALEERIEALEETAKPKK